MTVTLSGDGVIALHGSCPAEDAETLLRCLADEPGARVDWSACEAAHTAVVQVLLAVQPTVVGSPVSPFLREHVAGALHMDGSDA